MVIVAPSYKKKGRKFVCNLCGEIVSEQVGTVSEIVRSYLTSISN